jgi:CheY-like chemotaxis protein
MLHLLVVEDDQDTATSSAMLLRMYGHEVEVVGDGPSALKAVQAAQPDVVLLDLGLPRMDGWQVAHHIRQLSIEKRPFLIAISGYGHPESLRRSKDAGIDLRLVKPVDPTELDDLLKQHARLLDELKRRAANAMANAHAIVEETNSAAAESRRILNSIVEQRIV